MKQLKKTLLTLVALLAVTTGAWADETPLLTIESTDYASFKSGSKTIDDKVTVTFSSSVRNDGDQDGWYYAGSPSLLTVAGTNGYTITSCKFYTGYEGIAMTGYTVEGESPSVYLSDWCVFTDASKSVNIGNPGVTKIEVFGGVASASSSFEVAWNKAENSGTFTMPGGNVTLEPEYYPQATLAFQGLTAAEDAAAKTDAPLAVLADGAVTGGTLMYYVATDKNFSQADAIALAETQWSAAIPTAETIEAAGTYIMWYYIKGDAEHSDTDPVPLAVTLLPEPTYAVTFADDTAEPTLWTADPAAGVKKGQPVTVTYSGSKKVIGVKAEKKAKAPAEGKTYTNLQGGEVLHVGDKIQVPETDKYWFPGGETLDYRYTYEVVRVNISGSIYETTATESETGAYYALHEVGSNNYLFATATIDDSSRLPATATSDGIAVADNGFTNGYHKYIFSVHEK